MNRLVMPSLTLASLALFCATATYWTIVLTSPAGPLRVAALATPPASVDAAAQLFGGDASQDSRLRVSGVLSLGAGRGAAAIISENGAPARAIATGQRIDSNTTLREVDATGIVVERNGVRSKVALTPATGATGAVAFMH